MPLRARCPLRNTNAMATLNVSQTSLLVAKKADNPFHIQFELQWLMASGTWFGEIPVCCCLTGSAWLCLGVSPNHVPKAVRQYPSFR